MHAASYSSPVHVVSAAYHRTALILHSESFLRYHLVQELPSFVLPPPPLRQQRPSHDNTTPPPSLQSPPPLLQILVFDVALLFDLRSLLGGCNTTAVTLQV